MTTAMAMAATNGRYVLALGADNAGIELKNLIKTTLASDPRIEIRADGVPDASDATAYPHVGLAVAEAIARGDRSGIGAAPRPTRWRSSATTKRPTPTNRPRPRHLACDQAARADRGRASVPPEWRSPPLRAGLWWPRF